MDRKEKMFELVNHWRESGLSRKAFCAQIGITLSKFSYWVTKSKREATSGGFIPLADTADKGEVIALIYPNGVKVEVNGGNLSLLSQLIRIY